MSRHENKTVTKIVSTFCAAFLHKIILGKGPGLLLSSGNSREPYNRRKTS